MRRTLLALTTVLALGACASVPAPVTLEQQVVKQTEYVVRIPPAQLMTLPPRPADIDPDKADQAAVASWLISKEQYTVTLENQLKDIAGFFVTQQTQLDSSAASQNAQFKALAAKQQAQEGVRLINLTEHCRDYSAASDRLQLGTCRPTGRNSPCDWRAERSR